jgi:hypothetical protein
VLVKVTRGNRSRHVGPAERHGQRGGRIEMRILLSIYRVSSPDAGRSARRASNPSEVGIAGGGG